MPILTILVQVYHLLDKFALTDLNIDNALCVIFYLLNDE